MLSPITLGITIEMQFLKLNLKCTCGRRVIQTLTDYLPFPDFFPIVRSPILKLGNKHQVWTRGGWRGNGKDSSEKLAFSKDIEQDFHS